MVAGFQKFSTQEIHGVGVLGEDHHLAILPLKQLMEDALQACEFAVGRQLADADEEAFDLGLLLGGEGLALEQRQLIGIQVGIHGFIVEGVFVQVHP